MKPVDQPGAQLLTASGCLPLPAVQVQYADGIYGVVSAWELDPQELEDIAKTGRLWLEIRGTTQPPVIISTRCPYKTDPLEDQE